MTNGGVLKRLYTWTKSVLQSRDLTTMAKRRAAVRRAAYILNGDCPKFCVGRG